jgi:hypothetical protein
LNLQKQPQRTTTRSRGRRRHTKSFLGMDSQCVFILSPVLCIGDHFVACINNGDIDGGRLDEKKGRENVRVEVDTEKRENTGGRGVSCVIRFFWEHLRELLAY